MRLALRPHFLRFGACSLRVRRLRLRLGWAWAMLVAWLAVVPSAHADIWAYVDARGIAHFAADKLDDRYELFLRGGMTALPNSGGAEMAEALPPGSPITSSAAEGPAQTGAAPAAVTDWGASPYALRLATYIEGTAGYQLAKPLIREAASTHRIDEELLKALIAAESGFDPQAVSAKGAIGLMQVMPATAARFGVSGDARQPIERKLAEPPTNIRTGARYLRFLLNLFPHQLELALAAYNAGEGAVQRAGNRIPNIKETQNYVRTVMQLYAILKPAPPLRPLAAPGVAPAAPALPAAPLRTALPGTVPGRSSMPPSLANSLGNTPLTLPPPTISPN